MTSSDRDKAREDSHLVARLEGISHHLDVTCAIKSVVKTTVGKLDEVVDNLLVLWQLRRVDEVGCAKLLCPGLLLIVEVNGNDPGCLGVHSALKDGQAHTANAKDGDSASFFDLCRLCRRAVARGNATSEQACLLLGRALIDGDERVLRHDSVLAERRGAHEVEELLALAREALRLVWHHASTRVGADGLAEIRLARLAELALLALGRVEQNHALALLELGHALTDRLDDAGALMAKDGWESAFRVIATQGVVVLQRASACARRGK